MKTPKKTQLNQKTFYNWHADILKCLVKIQYQRDMNACQLCTKILKNGNKIKKRSIACSYIWHVNTPKYVY